MPTATPGKRAGLSSGLLAAVRPKEGSQHLEAPEVLEEAGVVVGDGEVEISPGDVAHSGRIVAEAPSEAPTDPVAVVESSNPSSPGSTEATGSFSVNVAQVVRQQSKCSRRTMAGSMLTPTLELAVLALLEGQVGKFTHSLCAPLREPVYFDPSTTNQPVPLVKSAPGDGDHVLCLGTH